MFFSCIITNKFSSVFNMPVEVTTSESCRNFLYMKTRQWTKCDVTFWLFLIQLTVTDSEKLLHHTPRLHAMFYMAITKVNSKDVNESRNARVSKKILVLENLISRRCRRFSMSDVYIGRTLDLTSWYQYGSSSRRDPGNFYSQIEKLNSRELTSLVNSTVKSWDVASYLHWTVVQIKAERDTLVKRSHWFLCAVDVRHFFRLHVALFMINCRFNNAISYCLSRNNKVSYHLSNIAECSEQHLTKISASSIVFE